MKIEILQNTQKFEPIRLELTVESQEEKNILLYLVDYELPNLLDAKAKFILHKFFSDLYNALY